MLLVRKVSVTGLSTHPGGTPEHTSGQRQSVSEYNILMLQVFKDFSRLVKFKRFSPVA